MGWWRKGKVEEEEDAGEGSLPLTMGWVAGDGIGCSSSHCCLCWRGLISTFAFNLLLYAVFLIYILFFNLFLKCILLIMLLQSSQSFSFYLLCTVPPFPPAMPSSPFPALVHVHGSHVCFGFSLSYMILNIALFCSYQLCFLIHTGFPPLSPFPSLAVNPPNDPHNYDSVLVLFFCLVWFFCCVLFLFLRFSC